MLPSDVHAIEPVVRDIVALCRAAGFSERQCGLNVPVATTEALANAMLRGNGGEPARQVGVAVEVDTTCLVVDVADQGAGFDVAAVEQSTAEADWFEREDGRGIFLMRALMDRVESSCADGGAGHRLRLVLYRT
ncbi:MAG: ATP-binding protein [Gemmatimonas sp.]|uniref:ATP-binding protein n=1 Tax=Gemmatimonas sp. TaxID=1962908 RepID=UPI00391F56DD|nr:ATP-binding protein [Gemmatimonadota bacterium]